MKIIHILGMAKSSLDLRGAKATKLELDYLRLLYAVERIQAQGGEAIGYLMVLSEKVAESAKENLVAKYGNNPAVSIIWSKPAKKGLKKLLAEKADQAGSLLLKKRINQAEKELSVAKLGKELGETALLAQIAILHPGVQPSEDLPLSIQWDYCGIVRTEEEPPQT